MAEFRHLSVLPAEVLRYLAPRPGGVYLDGTTGGGGHAALVLEASSPDGILIGLDRDAQALAAARERLAPFGERARLFRKNFAELDALLAELGIAGIDGFLLDLGVSSYQLDTGERGFSFLQDAPLDMRMDTGSGETAAELVNGLSEQELTRIIREYGEERWAKRIAAFIVRARGEAPIETTLQLADLVKGAIPRGAWEERLHPATRTFQAFRIAVNDELGSLERGLAAAFRLLKRGGRGVVISFHSLEDRIVKNTFRGLAQGCTCPRDFPRCVCGNTPQARVLTGKPVTAGEAELMENPRARSAKLRAIEKL
ncbi:MAG: 16S rRNA (cytosine(1402)-N(4))-methyltransferase RsmH [Geobacteraceae bacterium]|nr:16S rRNA (cytosine(1402)-N(4))-methyltransferase RsmH [Geobacteraceae bacterium]